MADEAFTDLGLTSQDLVALRRRFADWPRGAEARADRGLNDPIPESEL